ncbi:MAG: hypothetical protein GX044_11235 [Firmicutes bacterium]|nr:hypothetical protein [Bacillota bacterium]
MSGSRCRGVLYAIARLLGDFNAISSGSPAKIGKRAARRAAGRATGKALRRIFK